MLDHVVTLCLTFWGAAKLFSKVDTYFYTFTSSVWRFQFLHILATTCYYLSFDSSQPSGRVLVSHCGFNLPIITYSLEKCQFIYSAHIYSYPLSLLSCNNSLYILERSSLPHIICLCFLSLCGLSFLLVDAPKVLF